MIGVNQLLASSAQPYYVIAIHPFINKYFLSTYLVPSTVSGFEDYISEPDNQRFSILMLAVHLKKQILNNFTKN